MSDPITYTDAFRRTLTEEMHRDPTIFLIGTDLFKRGGHFAQVLGLGAEFGPERVRDTPISEAAIAAAGVGAAMNGMRPMVDMNFVDFAFGAMDEILNQAAKNRHMLNIPVPVVVRASAGAAPYAAQHTNSLEAVFAHTPGLVVATPATPADVAGMLRTALRGADPVIFLTHKLLNSVRGEVPENGPAIPFGVANVLREGGDVTIVGYGITSQWGLKAADKLAADGIEAEVVDLRTVYPLDIATVVESVKKTGRLVVVTDAPKFGSIASEVAAEVQEKAHAELEAPIIRLGTAHAPIPHSPPLLKWMVPDAKAVEAAARDLVQVAV